MHCERLQHLLRRGGLRVGLRGRLRRCSRWLGRFGRRKIGASEVCVIQSSAKEINALHLRILQHETSHTRKASDERAGASGAGRGFEACGVTRPSSPACTRTYSTRHRRHARRQMNEPALEWEGAVVRGLWGHSASIPCMLACLQHEISQAREGVRRTSWCQWGIARVRGLWRHEACIPCIFAILQHETSQARGVRRTSWCQWGIARVRGQWRHEAFIPCMLACLQHETSQARGVR